MIGVGASGRITALTDDTKEAAAVNFVYDRLRLSELRRNYWTFATKRAVLRPILATDKTVTFPTWVVGETYAKYDIVTNGTTHYQSLTAANIGNAVTDTANWKEYWGPLEATVYDSDVVYYPGELLYNSTEFWVIIKKTEAGATLVDGTEYHDLTGDGLPIGATTTLVSPLTGRTYAYVLPRDFLRLAPTDPTYIFCKTDHLIENKQLVTDDAGPLFIRYIRDEEDPTKFDPLFSEGLAAKIAVETCEELTQSNTKIATVAALYNTAIGDARLINAIEVGPVESEEDELISVRR